MKLPRFLRSVLVRGLLLAALLSTPAFAISKEELAALRTKAENGNGIAQYNLGLLYATLSEPLADPVEAYVWFNLAADNGATGRALVLLSSQMNPEQIAEAKHRLDVRRSELEARKKTQANVSASPVSAAEITPPPSDANSSPIVAAPSLPDPPISAAPLTERDFASLQAELKKMTLELAAAWKENEQLKGTVAKGGQASAAAEQLRAMLSANNEELAKLRAQVANFDQERGALRQKIIEEGQAQKDSLSSQLAAVTAKLQETESKLAQAANSANGELTAAKQTLASQGDQLQKLTAENQRLAGLATQLNSAAESKAEAEKEAASFRAELSTLRAQLKTAKTEAGTNLGATQKQLADAQGKLDTALRSSDEQRKEIEQLKAALAGATSDREALTKQVAELRTAPVKPDAAAEQRVARLTADLEAARLSASQAAQLQKQLSETQAKLASLDNDLAHANQEKARLDQQLLAAKAAAAGPSGEVAHLSTELGEVRGRLTVAEQALAQAKNEQEQATRAAAQQTQRQLAQLNSELQQLRQKSTASEEALVKANQERETLRQQLASAQTSTGTAADLASVEARLKSAEDALTTANAERDALSDRLSAAEKKASAVVGVMSTSLPSIGMGEDPVQLRKELDETQSKLTAALRTYQLQQDEVDRLQKSLVNIDGERAQLAERVHGADTQASQAQAQAAANQEAASQLAAVREQFRQAQNQIASLAGENAQLKNRLALSAPSPGMTSFAGAASPSRTSSVAAQPATSSLRPTPTRPVAASAPRTHTVSEGDTLTKIARHYYGSSDRWPAILEANRNVIKDVNNLTLGTTLKIP